MLQICGVMGSYPVPVVIPCFRINSDISLLHMLSAFFQQICVGEMELDVTRWRKSGLRDAHPRVHVNAAHGALVSQLLRHSCQVVNHVCADSLIINGGSVQGVLPKQVVVEGQMGQHNDDTALQRETSVCVSGLGELSVHVG